MGHFVAFSEEREFTSVNPPIVTMSDMESEDIRLHLMDPAILFPDFTKPDPYQPLKRGKAAQGNDKRRKQKDPKRKAVEPPPEETDSDKCRRHKEIQKRIKMMNGRLSFLEHCIQSEKEFPDLTDDDALVGFQNEHDELSSQKEQNLGELALFLPCPVLDCPGNAKNSTKQKDPPEPSVKKHSRLESRDSNKTAYDDSGFVSPKKTAKKLKFSVPIAGTSQPVNVQNKFSSLSEKQAQINPTTSDQTTAPISALKLAGKYFKIFCKTPDEHRIVTDYLKVIKEEFYVIDPPDSRPLKVVIKGLPISTEIDEIQEDLTSQGFSVEKVAQLTRSKTKSPLPIFMVELEKKSDSPDIFKVKKCCYLAVQVDAFNRRPGVSQCYNCNLFNHSSKNCFMRTRCLKCGESHRTNECPIKDKIQNPLCINCNKTGHMANWSQCEEFPKRKPRKGETIRNRNTSTESNKTSKRSPQISPSQLPSRALRTEKILPELRPPLKKPLQSMKKAMIKTLALKTRYANSEDFF
ncbi:nucleic-acid-binding protein from transposon X-element [Trichonephila clavipes]|nr:nucleic-acid-binding protein from transposon X-element [Trichonephila clavipes]